MRQRQVRSLVSLGLLLIGAAGCDRPDPVPEPATDAAAIARLSSTSGSGATGTVRFLTEANGVRVVAEFTGLTRGEHGFHIHENGDCSAPDASSAGAHFNPTGEMHGARDAVHRHLGDLGNLTAGPDGRARLDFVDTRLALTGPHTIIGRSVIVHAGPDDFQTQPSGHAGGRVACGIIVPEVRP